MDKGSNQLREITGEGVDALRGRKVSIGPEGKLWIPSII
jgi:hypothetical protein